MSRTAIVVGASSGFGRETALAVGAAGWRVVALARSSERLGALIDGASSEIHPVVGDGRDEELAQKLLAEHEPTAVLIGGGITPVMAPIEEHTWETLSRHWEADVAIVFNWLRTILIAAPPSLRRVVVLSSGAALVGSPGSGGYAGAKATVRFMTASAAGSAEQRGLATSFTAVLPQLTHDTEIGRAAVSGYAEISGGSGADALDGPVPYTAEQAGAAIAPLLLSTDHDRHGAYILGPDGLAALP